MGGGSAALLLALYSLHQWFSNGVPRNPRVPWKALWVIPIPELDWHLLVNCKKGWLQIVKILKEGAANQKRLRNTALHFTFFSFLFALHFIYCFFAQSPTLLDAVQIFKANVLLRSRDNPMKWNSTSKLSRVVNDYLWTLLILNLLSPLWQKGIR